MVKIYKRHIDTIFLLLLSHAHHCLKVMFHTGQGAVFPCSQHFPALQRSVTSASDMLQWRPILHLPCSISFFHLQRESEKSQNARACTASHTLLCFPLVIFSDTDMSFYLWSPFWLCWFMVAVFSEVTGDIWTYSILNCHISLIISLITVHNSVCSSNK